MSSSVINSNHENYRPLYDCMLSQLDFIGHTSLFDAACLFYGRSHLFPGLEHIVIETYHPYLVVKLYREDTQVLDVLLHADITHKLEYLKYRTVLVQHAYRKVKSNTSDFTQNLWETCWGQEIDPAGVEIETQENQLRYHVVLGRNKNLGLFLDMANGRKWVQEHSKSRKVLNLFAYTCAFSVAALAGGATTVFNVDMSKNMLKWGQKNHNLNDLPYARFLSYNIMQRWKKLRSLGPFDMVIIDPPTFQRGSFDAKRDYAVLIEELRHILSKDALVLACLNSPYLGRQFLIEQFQVNASYLTLIEALLPGETYRDSNEERGLKMLVYKN